MTRLSIGRRGALATAGCAFLAISSRSGRAAAMDQVTFQLGWLPGGDKGMTRIDLPALASTAPVMCAETTHRATQRRPTSNDGCH